MAISKSVQNGFWKKASGVIQRVKLSSGLSSRLALKNTYSAPLSMATSFSRFTIRLWLPVSLKESSPNQALFSSTEKKGTFWEVLPWSLVWFAENQNWT